MPLTISRLSESPIWEMQKRAYATEGVESWARGRVPFQITNNPLLASQYAEIAISSFGKRPFTVLELGAGSGKFSFLFLNELAKRGISEIRYILTDAAKKNELFWNNHPLLKPWIERGILKTAVLDPLVSRIPSADMVFANYFFDSIPQDLFCVEKGVLLEGIVSTCYEDLSKKLSLSYDFQPLKTDPYPDFPEAQTLLEEYRIQIDHPPFLFPIGALQTMRQIELSSKPDCLFLAIDRGPCFLEEVLSMKSTLTFHGEQFFSFPVNFHAIASLVEMKGGEALFSQSRKAPLSVALFSFSPIAEKAAFQGQLFGPLEVEAKSFSEMVKRLEESRWDANLFFFFFDRLQNEFQEANPEEKKQILNGIRLVKQQFFPFFNEEILLLHRLALFLDSQGQKKDGAECIEIAKMLEAKGSSLSLKRGETFEASNPQSLEKPSFILEIEKQFSLGQRIHSDADVEAFFTSMGRNLDTRKVLQFFLELRKKKNITQEQLEKVAARMGEKIPLE